MALRIDEQTVYDLVEEWGGMEEIEASVALILEYRTTDWYDSKNALLAAWETDHQTLYDLVISVLTATLTNTSLSFQALMGMLNHKIRLDGELSRIKILADLVGLISTTGLITITSTPGEKHFVGTEYVIDAHIPQLDRHAPITDRPQPVESNWDKEAGGSVILGHAMNHHTEFVRLSHLQRMGQIPFRINGALVDQYEESPKEEPVTAEEVAQCELFQAESLLRYEMLMAHDQRFFVPHRYCTRGRSYAGSYYLNPQGNSFKKAAIELADGEIVEGF